MLMPAALHIWYLKFKHCCVLILFPSQYFLSFMTSFSVAYDFFQLSVFSRGHSWLYSRGCCYTSFEKVQYCTSKTSKRSIFIIFLTTWTNNLTKQILKPMHIQKVIWRNENRIMFFVCLFKSRNSVLSLILYGHIFRKYSEGHESLWKQ